MKELLPAEVIEKKIILIRGHKVMLSTDLAELYDVEPRALIQAVERNTERFPADFIFMLSDQEVANLNSQFVISSWGGARRTTSFWLCKTGNSGRAFESMARLPRNVILYRDLIADIHMTGSKTVTLTFPPPLLQ